MANFDRLPYFKNGATVHQVSSFDPTGGNSDHCRGHDCHYYYDPLTDAYVVLDEAKPGTIYRIWVTEQGGLGEGSIRIYFDNEEIPSVNASLKDFFSGTYGPFLFPLVGSDDVSSGGFYCYYPFSFKRSVRVEFTAVPQYYQIAYHLYSSPDGVTTYTGTEDLTGVYDAWNNPSVDPKDSTGNQIVPVGPFDLPAGQTTILLDLAGPGSLRSFVLSLPQLITTQYAGNIETLSDSGRAHTGSSSFTVAIEPANTGVALVRRLNYTYADQLAEVYVDDQLVEERWSEPGRDYEYGWRDSRFDIPGTFTQGKTQIRIRIRFVGTHYAWSEYYYWVKTVRPAGEEVATDAIDVGEAESEDAHDYTIVGESWQETNTFKYPPRVSTRYDSATIDILSNARIRMYWDGESHPSVDVPLGFLFGVGSTGEGRVQGLLMGTNPIDHTFYNYFPMPYKASAQVHLVNSSSTDIIGAEAELQYRKQPCEALGSDAGYFTAVYEHSTHVPNGVDYVLLDIPSGRGHVVGVVLSLTDFSSYYDPRILEGDERVFVDACDVDPEVHGTGTEDYFNGGWYFGHRIFTLPVHGAPLFYRVAGDENLGSITMYRLSLADCYPFERRIKFAMEHGGENRTYAVWNSVVFAYLVSDNEVLVLSDALDVGDPVDSGNHDYQTTGQAKELDSSFVGRDDGGGFKGTGWAHQGSSVFTMNVDPENDGVRLARILDHSAGNQRANVYVDDVPAGSWFTGGSNADHRALYDYFEIPPSLTRGKSSIEVTIEFVGGEPEWNEFYYYAYSHVYPHTATLTPTTTCTPTGTPSPTPTTTSTATSTPSAMLTATATATSTPSATPTTTGTATSTPSPTFTSVPPTPSMTATSIVYRMYLPVIMKGYQQW